MSISRAEADLVQANREIQRLQGELKAAQERAIKIQHYLEMARVYDAGASVSARPMRRTRPPSGKSALYTSTAIETLRRAGHPMKTRELVRALAEQGVDIVGGKDPVITLSGCLSRADELDISDRKVGWKLKEWAQQQHDTIAATSDGQNVNEDEDAPVRQERDFASEPSEVWEQAARGA